MKSARPSGFCAFLIHKEKLMSNVTIQIDDRDYTEMIQLFDERIRSERARMAAFRGRGDRSNAYFAEVKKNRLIEIRNGLVSGFQHGEAEDA